MTRRVFLAFAIALGRVPATARAANAAPPDRVRICVFGLFHPRALSLRPGNDRPRHDSPGHDSPGNDSGLALVTDRDTLVLRGRETADVRIINRSTMQVTCAGRSVTTDALRVTGTRDGITDVELSVPGRITRLFRGQLDITPVADELVSVISMDLESAVASVVAAEQIASTALEALKAQAIAARSYLIASRGRHHGFDFCDTTHCQFLREPPAPHRRAAQAARETTRQVLAYRDRTIPAFYSASCGGRTLSLAEVGRPVTDGYPYFSVDCPYCARHPNSHRQGHGLGLCQLGAADLAATRHASCAEILTHYYPGTNLKTILRGV